MNKQEIKVEPYNTIYAILEPVFKWIQTHYPNGAFFIVDSDSAKLYIGNPELFLLSGRLTKPLREAMNPERFSEEIRNAMKKFAESIVNDSCEEV